MPGSYKFGFQAMIIFFIPSVDSVPFLLSFLSERSTLFNSLCLSYLFCLSGEGYEGMVPL